MAPSRVLKGNFRICMGNAVFCKYVGSWKESNPGSWKESSQGSWKELKMYLFGNNFGTTGGRELKFCRMVHAYCKQCLAKFQVAAPNSLRVIAVFVIWKCWPKFAHTRCQWSLGVSWVGFGSKIWISMGDATFGGKPANGIPKNLNLLQYTMVLKGNCFDMIGTNCPWFWWIWFEFPRLWSNGHKWV